MRYIKLFEKFESKEITSILSFLKTKIKGNYSYNTFLKYLGDSCKNFDIPISSLSNIKYMKRADALSLRGEASNQFDVVAAIFWFNATEGFVMSSFLSNSGDQFTDYRLRYRLNMESLKQADFALVIELDDILLDMYENDGKQSDINKKRAENRKDAIALLSDKEIRNMNLDRYLSKTYTKFSIDDSGMKLSNLNRLVIDIIDPKTLIYSMYTSSDRIYKLDEFIANIFSFIKYKDEYYYKNAEDIYKRSKKAEDKFLKFRKSNLEFKRLIEIMDKIGDKLYKIILSKRINSISDLLLMKNKFELFEKMMLNETSNYKISYQLEGLLRVIYRDVNFVNRHGYVLLEEDIIALENLYNDLDEIF